MPARPDELNPRPRRFYKTAEAAPAESGSAVLLDGRVAKTPAGAPLVAPTGALAKMLAEEWAGQGTLIDFAAMPATRLAFTAMDQAAANPAALADRVARYAENDLLCYFADSPETLLEREVEHWGPVLEWAEATLGLRFVRATGIVHQPQPQETVARVRALAAELDPFRLTGLASAAGLFGSAILALALERGELSADAALDLSRLDQAYQESRWGVDAEEAARTERLRKEAHMLGRWFAALGEG